MKVLLQKTTQSTISNGVRTIADNIQIDDADAVEIIIDPDDNVKKIKVSKGIDEYKYAYADYNLLASKYE